MQQRSRLWGLISLCGALILDVNLILRGKVQSFTQRYVHLDLSFPLFFLLGFMQFNTPAVTHATSYNSPVYKVDDGFCTEI